MDQIDTKILYMIYITSKMENMFEITFTANGEVIVTLLPVNEKLPWLMPAKFRPELVPEELMAPVLTVSIWLGLIAEWLDNFFTTANIYTNLMSI